MNADVRTIGANLGAYASRPDEDAEARDFAWTAAKRQSVLRAIRTLGPVARAADIGCRGGRDAAFYRDAAGFGETHGFEIAAPPLVRAHERGIVTHVWVSGESACPVPDRFFDLILALDVIEHIFDTDNFLEELRRVLTPRGHLIVATPNLAWWWSRLRLLRGMPPVGLGGASPTVAADHGIDVKHLRVTVAREWLRLFAQHGFVARARLAYNFPGLLRAPFDAVDRGMTRLPALAHSNIFVLAAPGRE